MGYYTNYNLLVENENKFSKEELIQASRTLATLSGLIEPEYITDNVREPFGWVSDDCMKWYDFESDMTKLGSIFPEMVFVLYGEGEERDDNWRLFVKGEQVEYQPGRIIFDKTPEWVYGE